MIDPYQEGRKAAKLGRSLANNPYKKFGFHHLKWEMGWEDYVIKSTHSERIFVKLPGKGLRGRKWTQ